MISKFPIRSHLIKRFFSTQRFPDVSWNFQVDIASPVEKAWPVLSDFGGCGKWGPPLSSTHIIGDGIDKVGCIRRSSSAGVQYDEKQLEKDQTNHVLKYAISMEPGIPFVEALVNRIQLVPDGNGKSKLNGTVTLTPKAEVSQEVLEKTKDSSIKINTMMFKSLDTFLQKQK